MLCKVQMWFQDPSAIFFPHGLKVGRLLMKLLPASHILVYLGEGR